MKRITRLLFVALVFWGCSSPADTDPSPEYTIRDGHPRLYITTERLSSIRERCANIKGTQANYYSILKTFGDKFTPDQSKPSIQNCLSLAFLYVVGEIPGYTYAQRSPDDYGNLGAQLLTQLYPPEDLSYFARYTPHLIACYDWLFPAMTHEQRQLFYHNVISVTDKMQKSVGTTGRYRSTREMYAYYGLAFYGDGNAIYPDNESEAANVNKTASEYCDFFASWHRDQQLAILESACKGGGYPSGTMYGEAPYPQKLWAFDAWNTASTDDLYKQTTCLTGFPLFWLYQLLPYRTHVRYDCANGRTDQPDGIVRFGDYRYIGYTAVSNQWVKTNIAQAQGVASEHGDRNLETVFNWHVQYDDDFIVEPYGGPYSTKKWLAAGPNLVWDIILRDGSVSAKSPAEVRLPLAHHFGSTRSGPPMQPDFPQGRPEGSGIIVMRSSWDDPGGTLLWFKASSNFLVHDHRDQGSFQLYKKGWLAIDSGQYEETSHRGNYSFRTIAHNSIIVYRPGERLRTDKTDPVWYGEANDGGQRWLHYVKTAEGLAQTENFLGGVTVFKSDAGFYDYVLADITRAYNSKFVTTEGHDPKVAHVSRSIAFLRPDEYIVIFDRIRSTKPEYPKRWILHSVYRPEIDGNETFQGIIPYSRKIPGKPQGVRLTGTIQGGISESRDTNVITLRAWNFGPSDGRMVCRTLLPANRITRIVGGTDQQGKKETVLADDYAGDGRITVENSEGFDVGDFVYLDPTEDSYSHKNYGSPYWPVDDLFYKGWGKISTISHQNNIITMEPHRYQIPKLPKGTVVMRSAHANDEAYEFMDAEYTQWPMHGEAVAGSGPFNMQHGCWRTEVEPVSESASTLFLHVILPCDKETVSESQSRILKAVNVTENDATINLTIQGATRTFKLIFQKTSPNAQIEITENSKIVLAADLSS